MAVASWLSPAPAVGFQWLPWKRGPYLTPWTALAIPVARGVEPRIGGRTYEESSAMLILALHLGYEFEL